MGKLVVTEFMSLDGIVEDPAGDWVNQFDQGAEAGAFKLNETRASECLLLGRVTYDGFAQPWPREQGEFADRFNSMPKYVVPSTLRDPSWTNTTVLRGDFPVILGDGRHLFGHTDVAVALRLVSVTPLGPDGVLLIIYRR
jgi:dihydrofolate reductase